MKSLFFLLFSITLFAQVDSNSVTVNVSRAANTAPDEVLLSVGVLSGYNSTLDDILAALKGTSISASNLSSVSTPLYLVSQPQLEWTFGLSLPLSKLNETSAALLAAQQRQPKKGGLTISFYVAETKASIQSQQSQGCDPSALLSDAQSQAQVLAAASNRIVGRLLGISAATTDQTPPCQLTVKFALIGL